MEFHDRETVDQWLMDIGYFRKRIAMDETCLFRIVSDQLYDTQSYYEEVRMACIEYANENVRDFRLLVTNWDEYIYKLTNHSVVCGAVEMEILAKKYKRDFIIFDGIAFKICNVTNHDFKRQFLLCQMHNNHYDAITKLDYKDKASFCQATNEDSSSKTNDIDEYMPFSFKLAKTFDPEQYRNIEYDARLESSKELQMKEGYQGGSDFKIGNKCLLNSEFGKLTCYIQDMNVASKEYCLVYVVETAEKREVKLDDLKPIPKRTRTPNKQSKTKSTNSYDKCDTFGIDGKKNVSFEVEDKIFSIENYNTEEGIRHLKGCPLVLSLSEQIQKLNLDGSNNNFEYHNYDTDENYDNHTAEIYSNTCVESFTINNDEWTYNRCMQEYYDASERTPKEHPSPVVCGQSLVPVAQFGLLMQNIPSVSRNRVCLISHENVHQHYQQIWLPIQNSAPFPLPYIMPAYMFAVYPNQQYNVNQYNSATKFRFDSQANTGTHNMNNNLYVPNYNFCNNYYEPNTYNMNTPPPPMNMQPSSGNMFIPPMLMLPPMLMFPMILAPPPMGQMTMVPPQIETFYPRGE